MKIKFSKPLMPSGLYKHNGVFCLPLGVMWSYYKYSNFSSEFHDQGDVSTSYNSALQCKIILLCVTFPVRITMNHRIFESKLTGLEKNKKFKLGDIFNWGGHENNN